MRSLVRSTRLRYFQLQAVTRRTCGPQRPRQNPKVRAAAQRAVLLSRPLRSSASLRPSSLHLFFVYQAIRYLKRCFKDDFEQFPMQYTPFDVGDAQEIEVVHLARLTDNHSTLPVALYAWSVSGGAVMRGRNLDPDDLERCTEGYGCSAKKHLAFMLVYSGFLRPRVRLARFLQHCHKPIS